LGARLLEKGKRKLAKTEMVSPLTACAKNFEKKASKPMQPVGTDFKNMSNVEFAKWIQRRNLPKDKIPKRAVDGIKKGHSRRHGSDLSGYMSQTVSTTSFSDLKPKPVVQRESKGGSARNVRHGLYGTKRLGELPGSVDRQVIDYQSAALLKREKYMKLLNIRQVNENPEEYLENYFSPVKDVLKYNPYAKK
jgi:hypothetical protein